MGLLDRWASAVTGPGPEHVPSPPKMRPLTAAGARINLRSPELVHTRHPEFQQTAWDYRDEVPELRFAGDFITNALGRLRVYPAENRPRGQEPVPLADGTVPGEITKAPGILPATRDAAKAAIDRLDLDRHGSSLLARMGENLEFAGECYLLGEAGEEGEQWTIRSVSEVIVTQGGARLIEPGHGGGASRELRPEEVELLRLWNPHPRYYDWPDAAISALLTTLEGMVILGRRGRAHDRSRISSGTALFVPNEFSLTRAGDASEVDEDDDPFMTALSEAMMAPIRDESDPSTVVPVVIRGDGMIGDKYGADMIKTVQLHSEDPTNLDERYEALVQRFARGINLPPEIVKGIGDTNHWTGAMVDATMVKSHIEPRAERMMDALTAAYFRPALKAMGVPLEQRNRVCLWFDPSELVQNPNREQAAKDAHGAGVISDAALRGELGFTEEHKPDNLEVLRRALDRERLAPASVPLLTKILAGRMPTDQDISRVLGEFTTGGQPKSGATVVEGRAVPDTPGGVRPAPALPRGADGPGATTAAASRRKGPRDDPTGPSVAGLALMAQDTGRVLMLQRAVGDPDDPAAGTWEFPGGHIEDGDETSLHGAMREWSEEVGQPVPPGGAVVHTWTSPDGVYQGHVVVIPEEAALDLAAERKLTNPDDDAEQCAWWDPEHARKNPALRRECRRTPWSALKRAVKTVRSPVTAAAEPARWRVDRRAGRQLARVDRDLTTRLHAHLEGALDRGVERAANRIRGHHARADATGPFEKGCDPAAVCAAEGRSVAPSTLADADLFDGAWTAAQRAWTADVAAAADQVVDILDRALPAPQPVAAAAGGARSRVRDTIIANGARAWDRVHEWLQRRAPQLLFGEAGDQQPVPPAVPRRAVAEAGGLPEQHPGFRDDGRAALTPGGAIPAATGPGTGEVALSELRVAGAVVMGWEWTYGDSSTRRDPFRPHRRLDGVVFERWDDPQLKAGVDADWIGSEFYSPGDHMFCQCVAEPIAIVPMVDGADPGDPQIAELRAQHIGSGEGAA